MRNKILFSSLFLLIIYLIFHEKPSISFYHWRSIFNLTEQEKKDLKILKVKKLYIKILDIHYKKSFQYISTKFITKPKMEIVPVVFIDNIVFKKIKSPSYFALIVSKKIKREIKDLKVKKIQFDCDWTLTTKDKYFLFLKSIKKRLRVKLSSTIRLHQIKYYKKTGVPPVDEGVLMYYNMSDIRDINIDNYVLDNKIAERYHYNFSSYPLFLNFALPIYTEAVVIRYGRVVNLIEKVSKNDFRRNFKKIADNRYVVTKSRYFKGSYLYKGDIVRFEEASKRDLIKASRSVAKILPKSPKEIIFYRLEDSYIKRIGYIGFKEIIDTF